MRRHLRVKGDLGVRALAGKNRGRVFRATPLSYLGSFKCPSNIHSRVFTDAAGFPSGQLKLSRRIYLAPGYEYRPAHSFSYYANRIASVQNDARDLASSAADVRRQLEHEMKKLEPCLTATVDHAGLAEICVLLDTLRGAGLRLSEIPGGASLEEKLKRRIREIAKESPDASKAPLLSQQWQRQLQVVQGDYPLLLSSSSVEDESSK